MGAPSFLVVEDEPLVARGVVNALTPHGSVEAVGTLAAARAALETKVYSAVVVDVGLPDGSGMAIVATARKRDPKTLVLLMSGFVDTKRLADAHVCGVCYLLKPVTARQLGPFVKRAAIREKGRNSRTETLVDEWAGLFGLTPAEAEVLRLAALGTERRDLPDLLDVAPGTIKRHVQSLLDKMGAPSLEVAVSRLLRAAVDAR